VVGRGLKGYLHVFSIPCSESPGPPRCCDDVQVLEMHNKLSVGLFLLFVQCICCFSMAFAVEILFRKAALCVRS
jgi:hypothetical protein